MESFENRLLRQIKLDPEARCWVWLGGRRNSYGAIKVKGKSKLAHRVSYETFVGPIPPGLTIDHLCRQRLCINPKHLEPVTMAENHRRGAQVALRVPKTHCINGHAYTPDNIYLDRKGVNRCMECARKSRLRSYYKKEVRV